MHLFTPLLLAALLLGGCGLLAGHEATGPEDRGGPVDGGEPVVEEGGTVRLALLAPSPETHLAALEGFLHVEGKCLYVAGPGGSGPKTLPAFSFPARWDAEHHRLLAPGGAFTDGQRVRLGGSEATDRGLLSWVQRADPSCADASIFVAGMIEAAPEADKPRS
ncbi:MAG TPA: hypothetical protein VN231_13900 [Allosphingosinicella sp.]|nr:hypothetical protein [Allosphingosinicella sp.]